MPMKSPILILFIIFNLLAINLVSASNMYDGEMTESHLIQLQADESLNEAVLASCIDESSCDDFCHVTTHMLGFISQTSTLTVVGAFVSLTSTHEMFYSLTLDPLLEPPQSLI